MTRLWVPALMMSAGCGRFGFDQAASTANDPELDADVATRSCWDAWKSGQPELTAPTLVEAVAGMHATEPSLANDDRTLYLTVGFNLYAMQRAAASDEWSLAPVLEAAISTGTEGKLSTSGDGMFAVLVSGRGGSVDLWTSQRSTVGGPFESPTQSYVDALRSSANELDPELSTDTLRLYYAPYDGTNQRIVVASRAIRTDPFGPPIVVTGLQTSIAVGDPSLSPDELVIAFSSGATTSENDLYFATRSDRTASFSTPTRIAGLNLPGIGEWDVELARDGCELYFVSDRTGATELYSAKLR